MVLEKKMCCNPGSEERGESIDFKCCTIDEYDTSVSMETLIKPSIKVDIKVVAQEEITLYEVYFVQSSDEVPVLRPPPLANRDIHNHFQVYLI